MEAPTVSVRVDRRGRGRSRGAGRGRGAGTQNSFPHPRQEVESSVARQAATSTTRDDQAGSHQTTSAEQSFSQHHPQPNQAQGGQQVGRGGGRGRGRGRASSRGRGGATWQPAVERSLPAQANLGQGLSFQYPVNLPADLPSVRPATARGGGRQPPHRGGFGGSAFRQAGAPESGLQLSASAASWEPLLQPVAPLQQLEAAVHQDFQHGQRPNQERRRRGQQQLSSVKRAGKQPVRPGQAAVQAQGPEAPELATEGRVQEPAEAPLCVVCCDVLKVAAVGVCNHKEVCARCSLRMRLCYGDMKCSLCKTDLPEVVMARWRPQGIPDWSAYEARRKGLWQRPHWARGVLIDDWKPRDSEARPLHLDMVALTAQACPKCDPEGLRPYPSNKSLTRHVEFEHEMKMCLTCLAARRQFPLELPVYTRAELREHMQEHPNCQFCDIQFYGLDELFHHMQRTHFTCHVCQMAGTYCHFAQADELIVHLREEHYLCEEEECELCFVAFRTVQELQQHHREVHLNRMPRFDRSRARRVNLADMVSPVRGNGPSGAPRNAQAAGANAQAAAQARQQRSAQRALHVSDSSNSLSAESGGFEAEPLQQGQGGFMMIDDDVGLAQPGIPQPSSSRPASTRPPREDFPELPSSGAPAYRAPPRPQRLAGRPAEEFPALQASAGPAPPQAAAASRPALVRLTVKCPCGRRSSHSVVEQGQTPAPLQCDTDCERQKRQQQIAGAFGIADPAHHVPVFDRNRTPHYSQELLLYAWNNPYWIDGVEHALAAFANDKAKKRQRMAPMPRQQRAMAHALAAEYGLTTQSIGTEPARCVELFQSATASVPNKLLSATVAGMTREQILQVEDKVAGHCMYFYDVEEGVDLEPFLGQWRGQFTLEVTGPDTAVARFQTPELLKEARVLMGGGLRGLFRIQVPKSAPGQGSDTIQAGPSHGSASAPRAEGAPQLAGGSSRRAPARQQGAGGAAEGGRQSAGDSGEDWQPVAGAGRGRQQVADQAQDSEPEREAAADSGASAAADAPRAQPEALLDLAESSSSAMPQLPAPAPVEEANIWDLLGSGESGAEAESD